MWDAVVQNAYWLVYAGTILEGETALLLGSLAANRGAVELIWVIAAAFAGATTGDQISYQVFRRFGPGIVSRNETLKRRSGKARRLLKGHPVKFIIVSRFFWGLRSACMLALAASDVPSRVFVPANLIACALWALIIGSLGYVFSGWAAEAISAMDAVSGRAPAVIGGIALLAAVIVAGRYAVLKFWRSRESL